MDDGSDDVPALAGALELHAATTCARAGREGDAWRYWDRASVIVRRLPDGYNHPWTMFGASNVELHAVSISADLSKSQEARNRAEQIDPEEIPSRERRGRLGVEIARSYGQRQDYPGMLHWLEFAYQTSTDSVRYSPSARQMASEAVDHGGPLIRTPGPRPGGQPRPAPVATGRTPRLSAAGSMLRLSADGMALNVTGAMTANGKVDTRMPRTSSQALETLAAELQRRGYEAKIITPEGREPWLAVRNPQVPMLAETVLVHAEWFWWPWQDRIGPATDVPAAADRVLRVLAARAVTHEHPRQR